MTFFIASSYILGTVLLGASAYSGLMLSGIVDPPYDSYGGVIGGLLPTATAIFGMTFLGLGNKLSILSKEPAEPKPVEEFG